MKAVIFDRDGVIVDSESCNIIAAIKAFKQLGISIKEEEKKLVIGRHPDDYHKLFLKKYKFSYPEFRKIQKEMYQKLIESAPLLSKTIALVKELHKSNVKLALTTSSGKRGTDMVLEMAGLKGMFDLIITHEDYTKRKPDPEPYIVTARKLGVDPKDCVAVEDTSVGVESAKRAGMKCIVIPNRYTKGQDFSKADIVVESAENISLDLLNSL